MELFDRVKGSESAVWELVAVLQGRSFGKMFTYYTPEEAELFGTDVLQCAVQQLGNTRVLIKKEQFVSLYHLIDSSEFGNVRICGFKPFESYLGKGYYFIPSAKSGIYEVALQCIEDYSAEITGEEFVDKSLVTAHYEGKFFYDPNENVIFIQEAELNQDVLVVDVIEELRDLITVKEMQEFVFHVREDD